MMPRNGLISAWYFEMLQRDRYTVYQNNFKHLKVIMKIRQNQLYDLYGNCKGSNFYCVGEEIG